MSYDPFVLFMRFLLKEHHSSHSDLARRSGLGRSMLQSMVSGRTAPPLKHMARIADALRLDGEERSKLLFLAHLAHSPAVIQQQVELDRIEIGELNARLSSLSCPCEPLPVSSR